MINIYIEKIQKVKVNREDAILLIFKLYFYHITEGFFRSPGA